MRRHVSSMNQVNRYFKILGLAPDAAPAEARQAYRALVRTWHPDRFGDDPSLQLRAQERLKEINEAYRVVQEVISAREEAKLGVCRHATSSTKTPFADHRASPSSAKADKPACPPERQPITPLFYFWPNVLLFLLTLAGIRLSWQRSWPPGIPGTRSPARPLRRTEARGARRSG